MLKDVFIDTTSGKVRFEELNGDQSEFALNQVVSQRTYKGITKVLIKTNIKDTTLKFFYLARTKYDRDLLGGIKN